MAATLDEARMLMTQGESILLSLSPLKTWQRPFHQFHLPPSKLLSIFQNLSQLCRAGIPLPDALGAVGEKNTQRPILEARSLLEQGQPLSKAFTRSGIMNNPLLLAFLEQAEVSGDYPQAFDQISTHLSWSQDLKKRLKKAIAYPALVMITSVALMIFLLTFVVPQLVSLYQQSGLELAGATQALLTLSHYTPNILMVFSSLAIFLMIGIYLLLIQTRHAPYTLRRLLRGLLTLPLIGKLLTNMLLLQYLQSLHALLATHKKSILTAMTYSERAVRPAPFQLLFHHTRLQVEYGTTLSQALVQSFTLSLSLQKILEVGEHSGALTAALKHSVTHMETTLQNQLDKVLQRLGPLMLCLVGGLLIFIIVAVFLPLYGGLGGLEQ
jgi:type II secretory pathway component PulF